MRAIENVDKAGSTRLRPPESSTLVSRRIVLSHKAHDSSNLRMNRGTSRQLNPLSAGPIVEKVRDRSGLWLTGPRDLRQEFFVRACFLCFGSSLRFPVMTAGEIAPVAVRYTTLSVRYLIYDTFSPRSSRTASANHSVGLGSSGGPVPYSDTKGPASACFSSGLGAGLRVEVRSGGLASHRLAS
jgi:hypothetical protein